MPVELKIPSVGESITEVQIGAWLKSVGQRVERDQAVVTVESDKATVEVPAPVSGIVSKQLKQQGEKARVGEVVALLEEVAGAAAPAAPPAPAAPAAAPAPAVPVPTVTAPVAPPPPPSRPIPVRDAPPVMPAAQRALDEHGLQPQDVAPSGPGGRLLKEDVLREVELRQRAQQPQGGNAALPQCPREASQRVETVTRMTPIRKRIAERLLEAQQNAALLTTFNEIDMSAVMALRSKYQESFTKQHGVKLGFMSFFVKAACEALRAIPQVNAQIRGEEIISYNYCDIGVAVGGGKGLVVPVIRSAEQLSFASIEKTIADFGQRAQANKIGLDELKGGTFTITNGGIYGSLLSTPIINPPQSGILGLHAIQERPIALNGQVVIRPMMYVALTYDHRLVDGREAVTFLKRIKDVIEDPSRLMLEI